MFLTANQVPIYYERQGRGRPLILVHGNGEDHTIFDEAVCHLRAHFTCYALDSRDHGQSGRVSELHYHDMAKDILAFLEALDLRDVVFYGFSDGGIVGLLAAQQTDRISTLILSGANLYPHGMTDEIYRIIEEDYQATGSLKSLMMLREPNITDWQLRRIKLPTLILAGTEDLIKDEHTRHIARTLPNSSLHILAGEGHETYIIHSTVIAGEILRFLGLPTALPVPVYETRLDEAKP